MTVYLTKCIEFFCNSELINRTCRYILDIWYIWYNVDSNRCTNVRSESKFYLDAKPHLCCRDLDAKPHLCCRDLAVGPVVPILARQKYCNTIN